MASEPRLILNIPDMAKPRVIIGGGLGLAKELLGNQFPIVLFRNLNYLLYQIASARLETDAIAEPLPRSVSDSLRTKE